MFTSKRKKQRFQYRLIEQYALYLYLRYILKKQINWHQSNGHFTVSFQSTWFLKWKSHKWTATIYMEQHRPTNDSADQGYPDTKR